MSKKNGFSNDEVYCLCNLINSGNEEVKEILWRNYESHIKDFIFFNFYSRDMQVTEEDMLTESYFGFAKAVEKYNPSYGVKFTTYLDYWLRDCLSRLIKNNSNAVRIPIKRIDLISRVKTAMATLPLSMSLVDRYMKVAELLDIEVDEVIECLKIDENCSFAVRLDESVDEDEETHYHDIIEDNSIARPYAESESKDIQDSIMSILKCLSNRERQVVILRFGINGDEPIIEAEIARRLDVSRAYVNRTLKSAIGKLKTPAVKKVLISCIAA